VVEHTEEVLIAAEHTEEVPIAAEHTGVAFIAVEHTGVAFIAVEHTGVVCMAGHTTVESGTELGGATGAVGGGPTASAHAGASRR
jgi:hypothetical protein